MPNDPKRELPETPSGAPPELEPQPDPARPDSPPELPQIVEPARPAPPQETPPPSYA